MAIVVNVIDHNRVLVDGVSVPRMVLPTKWIILTDIKVHGAMPGMKHRKLMELAQKHHIFERYEKSAMGKKFAQLALRRNMTDFDRFQVAVIKGQLEHKARVAAYAQKN